jgi:hypothetical protein
VAQAFAIGAMKGGEALSRASVQKDCFISVTGGIVGLSAPDWRTHIPPLAVIVLLGAIASAITASGWLMAQPSKAGPRTGESGRRVAIGAIAGACMGAGIGLVRVFSWLLTRAGWSGRAAFIAAFAAVGCVVFLSTLKVRLPRTSGTRLALFGLAFCLLSSSVCTVAFVEAGSFIGILALAASTGMYHAVWFTGASVVGNRIGSARAAVIATTLEGAVGFTAFIVFRMFRI